MKSVILALFLVAGAFAISQSSSIDGEDLQTLWTSWKLQYNMEYSDEEVEATKFAVWSSNYYFVQEWNAAGNTAVLAVNQFADLTNEEFGAIYSGSQPAPSDVVLENLVSFSDVEDVPSSWDWRDKGAVTPIKNQEQCGSCWTFATVATTEGLYFLNGNTLTSFSEQQIVDCDAGGDGCGGGWPYQAMAYVAKNGLETEAEYPYAGVNQQCAYNKADAIETGVTGAAFVTPKSVTDLMAAIVQQPIAVIIEADQNAFQLYSSGVITSGCGVALDHAVTAIGYGTESGQGAWIVKNSWGTSWGVEGYVYISTGTSENDGLGPCGILSQPQYPKGLSQ